MQVQQPVPALAMAEEGFKHSKHRVECLLDDHLSHCIAERLSSREVTFQLTKN